MELNNINSIKWETIIGIPEFINVLNISTLKELTLLSKSFRLKLQSKLFETIQVDGEKFPSYLSSSKNDLICEYFNFRNYIVGYGEDGEADDEFNSEPYKNLEIEPTVSEIQHKLSKFKYHTKNFGLVDLERAGYYLLQILDLFPNLTTLKLDYCTVSLEGFSKLLSNLPNLSCLELNNSSLAVLPTQEPTLNNLKFPQSIKKLVICGSNFTKIVEPQSAFDFLFEKLGDETFTEIILPPKHIQSLKKFNYYANTRDDNGLNKFLEINDHLEYLSLESNFIDSRKFELISRSNKLKKLSIYCKNEALDSLHIPILSSITKLRFINANQEFLPNLEALCLSCINLSDLNIILDELIYDEIPQILSTITARIIPKSNNLRAFGLCLFGDYSSVINLTELNNVARVRVQANLDTLYNLEFANNEKLIKVEFFWKDLGFDHDINLNDIKTKFENYEGWRFIYGEGLIKGKRVIDKN
jgi:hypothetical protein